MTATRNQLGNAKNQYQTTAKRVLTVCSAGLLRSPTAANVLHQRWGHNTRACGAEPSYALIPLNDLLIHWADEIVFVERSVADQAQKNFKEELRGKWIVTLNLPDQFEWNAEELRTTIEEQYTHATPVRMPQ